MPLEFWERVGSIFGIKILIIWQERRERSIIILHLEPVVVCKLRVEQMLKIF